MGLLTNSVDSLLTLFNIDGVHDLLASLLGDLASVLLGVLVALLLLLVFTVRTTGVSVVTRISGTLVVITSIVFMMSIMISMTKVMTTRVSSTIGDSCKSCRQEENKELHCYSGTEDFPPCVTEGAEVNSPC